jgi:hypothetical protein
MSRRYPSGLALPLIPALPGCLGCFDPSVNLDQYIIAITHPILVVNVPLLLDQMEQIFLASHVLLNSVPD